MKDDFTVLIIIITIVIIIIIIIIIIINTVTLMENTLKINPQPAALDFGKFS